jgi:hypothetical protein
MNRGEKVLAIAISPCAKFGMSVARRTIATAMPIMA